MGTADNFCLRWNDFESNISSSFRELRRDNEFFDVTLCCDNGSDKVPAHKVILAACSPLFRRILAHNSGNPNPLLYLKGINKRELTAVLNFMYHGEVNVAQDSLNAFLAVAEELAVKGLTTDSTPDGSGYHKITNSGGDDDPDYTPRKGPGRPPKKAKVGSTSKKRDFDGEDSNSGEVKRVKAEPGEGQGGSGASGGQDDYGDDQGDYGGGEGYDDNFGGYDDLDESGADASGSGEVTKEHRKPRLEDEFSDVGWSELIGRKRMEVWQYFLISITDKDILKCKICSKIMRGSSSITSFKYHLENVHKIGCAKKETNLPSIVDSITSNSPSGSEGISPDKKDKRETDDFYRVKKYW